MLIYKILRSPEWMAFERDGVFAGSADDLRDGYIHLSTDAQTAGTMAKYFAGEAVTVVTLDTDALGDALRWEESRGGMLFPHLYRALDRSDVIEISDAPPPPPA
ncbi:DUF952 domain-containing protein [Polymorphobacter sp. PAMC 29334]|uniref:DUF952 domain-containing protein n=1 Tax=Polymorphobacter sp. PAMC 29334 TaxID=2862331 RepID=UPI001C671050|nr:DUF952 domain-containing protein [Polymorphobacter sp. PAMC 29334]QYE34605.1 DUF952 domain-containing protein [Polymorphobacter sp. PAMC 29334]